MAYKPQWQIDQMADEERWEKERQIESEKRKGEEHLYEIGWIEKPSWYKEKEHRVNFGTAESIQHMLEEKFELERKIRCYKEDEETIGSPTRYREEKEYQLEHLEERLETAMEKYIGGN